MRPIAAPLPSIRKAGSPPSGCRTGKKLTHHYREGGPERGTPRAIMRGRWWGISDETIVGELEVDSTLRFDHEFDDAGRVVGIDENGAGHRYGYAGGRLVSATYPPAGEGDRLLQTVDAVSGLTDTYRYDAAGAPRESGTST